MRFDTGGSGLGALPPGPLATPQTRGFDCGRRAIEIEGLRV